jgi:hypothetical protein
LEGRPGRGVLTGTELGSAGVEADKRLEEEEVPRAWFSSSTRTVRAPATRGEGNSSHQ